MTDAEYEAQRERIRVLMERWLAPLGLRSWTITWKYCREGIEGDKPGWKSAACVNCRWEYLTAEVSLSMPTVAEASDQDLEETFLHACCHILVNEMKREGKANLEHEERVVTTLAKAFMWVREAAIEKKVEEE